MKSVLKNFPKSSLKKGFTFNNKYYFSTTKINYSSKDVAEKFTGVGEKFLGRKALIYHTSKSAMQSGTGKTGKWIVEFEKQERWKNPLMGE